MAEKRDMLDDLIDIQQDWEKVSNPFGDIAGQLVDPSKAHVFNPADYKGRPRANTVYCSRVAAGRPDVCGRCLEVCPVDAIEIGEKTLKVNDNCRECGLCMSVCPTEAFQLPKHMSKQLYDRIARIASAYEQCYVTCTRALGRYPKDNEVVLPCVGLLTPELWFALLVDYDNISVYLPVGVCDRCQTTTGEEVYVDHIGTAEQWSGYSVGLEVDEGAMTHELTRAYKRGQFVSNLARTGSRALMAGSPALLGARAVAERIKRHTQKLNDMQRTLEDAVGGKTSQNRRHVLTQSRKMLLSTIQESPVLATVLGCRVPQCNSSLCTMCGDCVRACSLHVCDLDASGHVSVEPAYCVGCGACAAVCESGALTMVPADPADLVVPDPNAAKAAEQRAMVQKAKEEGRAKISKYLDALEHLGETDDK
ncbi:MAG: 4Fe-4S binding protein [Atopobiaceae bacterium]|nr:4Fe-4S binding protein [Atopobiaceae bacterium]